MTPPTARRARVLLCRARVLLFRVRLLLFGALLLSLSAIPGHAQVWARSALSNSPRHREYVNLTHNGRVVNTFVVYPEVAAKAPVVVLVHEIFGLSDWAKLMADELAAKGYIVLAPDLLTGANTGAANIAATAIGATQANPATDAELGGTDSFPNTDAITKAVSALAPAQVLADLDAVADYGLHLPSANGRIAAVGFCWGGGKAFSFAAHRPSLAAAFVLYGPPPPAADMRTIAAPVYGFYAENDARITATVPQTAADMKSAGKPFSPVIYAGAGHGFMRSGQAPDAKPADQLAFQQAFERLAGTLRQLR